MIPDNAETAALRKAVECAVLAPSGHNTQPWQFRLSKNMVELWADTRRALAVSDPQCRELVISCGAALLHLRLALEHFRFEPHISRMPNPDHPNLLATVVAGGMAHETEEELFDAIARRHTNRGPFDPARVPADEDLLRLETAAMSEGAELSFIAAGEDRSAIAELVAAADRLHGRDPAYRKELAAWVHAGRAPDGIPALAMPGIGILPFLVPLALRFVNWGERLAERDKETVLQAPVLAVLTTGEDSSLDWLRAGEALARVLLEATILGLSASFLNQAIETPELREELRQRLPNGACPQLMIRLGYATDPAVRSPRRTAGQVIVS